MTRKEREKAIDALKISAPVMAVTQEEFNDYIQTLNKIMDWLEQEPCTDAISRQAVAEVLLKYAHSEVGKAFAEFLVSQINDLPPVTPTEKVGHWINPTTMQCMKEQVFYYCSVCGNYADANKYCPHCGSRMIQEVEE